MLKTLIENCTEDCLQCVGKILKVCYSLLTNGSFLIKLLSCSGLVVNGLDFCPEGRRFESGLNRCVA